jgi:uncharacterized protein
MDKDFVVVANKYKFSDKNKEELYSYIKEIIESTIFLKMGEIIHHLESRKMHVLEVCCYSYLKSLKNKKCNRRSLAIGSLLHDFFLYDWQKKGDFNFENTDIKKNKVLPNNHGFSHHKIAYGNAVKYFPHLMDEIVKDIILKHMWPLTVYTPKYRESWIVCSADKMCSIKDVKRNEIKKYLGLTKKQ